MNDNPVQAVSPKLIGSAVVAGVFVVSSLTILLFNAPPYPYSNMLLTGISLVAVACASYIVIVMLVADAKRRRTADVAARNEEQEARRTFEDDVAVFLGDLLRAQHEQTVLLKELANDLSRLVEQQSVVPKQLERCIQDLADQSTTVNGKLTDLRNFWIEDGLPPVALKEFDPPIIEGPAVVDLGVEEDRGEEHGE